MQRWEEIAQSDYNFALHTTLMCRILDVGVKLNGNVAELKKFRSKSKANKRIEITEHRL